MTVVFNPSFHTYSSDENQNYISATKLISLYKPPFDAVTSALKSSNNKKSKWYKMNPEQILEIWEKEKNRSTTLGQWYHNKKESEINNCESIIYNDTLLPIYDAKYTIEGYKIARDQKLSKGIYPEHLIYLESAGVAGQSDRVTVSNSYVDILDHKTNKEIKKTAFKNYEGITQKMLFPLNHLDDCNFNHYTLQLSLYMYIILKHNPDLSAGKLTLEHILFEEDFGKDPYGYPIYLNDEHGNPIIKEIITYDVPYLKNEIITMLQDYKINKKL